MPVVISQLYIYPVKSCGAVAVASLPLDALGAVHDRRYMLVDDNGRFVTQRQYPHLVHVQLQSHPAGWLVTVPGAPARILPFAGLLDKPLPVSIWNDTYPAYDQGEQWAEFFSRFLGRQVRLVYTADDTERRIDPRYAPDPQPVSFADGFPLLLANTASLDALNAGMDRPIEMLRFRPNVVVSGAEAFAENGWGGIAVPGAVLSLVKPCVRCAIPTINRATGAREPQVWQALLRHCAGEGGEVYFGQNAIHHDGGILRVGDPVAIM